MEHKRVLGIRNKDFLLIKVMNSYFDKKEPKRRILQGGRRFFNVDKFFRWLFTTTNGYTVKYDEDISYAVILTKHFWKTDLIWSDIGRGGQLMFAFKTNRAKQLLKTKGT